MIFIVKIPDQDLRKLKDPERDIRKAIEDRLDYGAEVEIMTIKEMEI